MRLHRVVVDWTAEDRLVDGDVKAVQRRIGIGRRVRSVIGNAACVALMALPCIITSIFLLSSCGGGGAGAAGGNGEPFVVQPPAQQQVEQKAATLFGIQVVPPVASLATAEATVTMGEDLTVLVEGVSTPNITGVHLHRGVAGTNGPLELELLQDPDDATRWMVEHLQPSDSMRTAFSDSELYVDVHSPAHPGGELRAQIPGRFAVGFVALVGGDVVPPVVTPKRAIAAITFREICGWEWEPEIELHVNTVGVDDVTEVTLRRGAVGENGPTVRSLAQDANKLSHWSLTACMEESVPKHADFRGHYLSVETHSHPEGEIRGTLETRNVWDRTLDEFRVVSVSPSDGSRSATAPLAIAFGFSSEVDPESVSVERVDLRASGGDAQFDNGNELQRLPVAVAVDGASIAFDLTGVVLPDDVYQVTLDATSDSPLIDVGNRPLRGNGDPDAPIADFFSTFAIDSDSPPAATLEGLQQVLFTPGCALSGCHGEPAPRSELSLVAGHTYGSVVNVPSGQEPLLDLVEPGSADESYIVHLLEGPVSHSPGQPRLTNTQLQILRSWIDAGAMDN